MIKNSSAIQQVLVELENHIAKNFLVKKGQQVIFEELLAKLITTAQEPEKDSLLPSARLLTRKEISDIFDVMCDQDKPYDMLQRKFCSVNGIAIKPKLSLVHSK